LDAALAIFLLAVSIMTLLELSAVYSAYAARAKNSAGYRRERRGASLVLEAEM
jgi:hypothetical protein